MSRGSAGCVVKKAHSWPLGFHQSFPCFSWDHTCRHPRPNCSRRSWEQVFSLWAMRVGQEKWEKARTRLGAPCKGRKSRELYCFVMESPCHQILQKALLEEISLRSKRSGRLKKGESASLLHWGATALWGYFVDVCKPLYAACSIGLQVAYNNSSYSQPSG